MEPSQFDRLARVVDTAVSRRRVLGGLLGLAGAAGFGNAAQAGKVAPPPVGCLGGRRVCWRNSQCCSGVCQTGRRVPVRDRNRCTCGKDEAMIHGRCVACLPREMVCGSACVARYSNDEHCGACGRRCPEGTRCSGTECLDAVTCEGVEFGYADDALNVYETYTLTHSSPQRNCTSSSECTGACPAQGTGTTPTAPCVCIVHQCDFGLLIPFTHTPGEGSCEHPVMP